MKIEPRYFGLFAGIAEANDISAELGVSFEEAKAILREREEPNVIFFQDPKLIAAKVAAQEGITPEEASAHLARFDIMALETFHSVPRSELH